MTTEQELNVYRQCVEAVRREVAADARYGQLRLEVKYGTRPLEVLVHREASERACRQLSE